MPKYKMGEFKMKAIICTKYGAPEVLILNEIEKPIPKDNEVLIKVRAASINTADLYMMRGKPVVIRSMTGGFLNPRKNMILGADISGSIESLGRNVTQFTIGDDVFGDTSKSGFGGFAEYVCVSEDSIVLKPKEISYEEAAAVPMSALTALQALRDKGEIKSNYKVLINGSTGGVGTFALQIAKVLGAEVTGVCSTRNLDMVRSLGADQAIDYTKEDFTKNGKFYDLIIAANGYNSIIKYNNSLSPKGVYVMSGGSMAQIFQAMLLGPLISKIGDKKICNVTHKPNQKDLLFMKELLENKKVQPVIDKIYPLKDITSAFKYLEEGHAKGKVVIQV